MAGTMTRLWRPSIPVRVKCMVALAQTGEMWPQQKIKDAGRNLGKLLEQTLGELAELLVCERKDLRLDHFPALALRQRIDNEDGTAIYFPDANNPDYLIYRSHADHLRKTNLRGDGAQHSDRVLIKRLRRRAKRSKPKRGWPSRPFPKGQRKFPSRPLERRS